MKNRILSLLALLFAGIFYGLFNGYLVGLNLSLFAILIAGTAWFINRRGEKSLLFKILLTSVFFLSVAYAWHGEGWTAFMLIVSLFLFSGSLVIAEVGATDLVVLQSAANLPMNQFHFIRHFGNRESSTGAFQKWRIYILPLGIVLLFTLLYSNGNSQFGHWVESALEPLLKWLDFSNIADIIFFLFGLCVANMFLSGYALASLRKIWSGRADILVRKREKKAYRPSGLHRLLLNEYRAGVFLLVVLNILLLIVNMLDLNMVWFGFKWSGQLLKEFVHEGTWMLIISIVLAGSTALYFFRGNLNFFEKSPVLMRLTQIWLIQNAFLVLSVAMRNWRYIDHFGLAYKRIGVMFFLFALACGLIFIWFKVHRKEGFRLFSTRSLAMALIVMAASAIPDWSNIIAKYNFRNFNKSYLHLSFLAEMPDHVLPVLKGYQVRLPEIEAAQQRLGFDYSDTVHAEHFNQLLNRRILRFRESEARKNWREWIWANHRAAAVLGESGTGAK